MMGLSYREACLLQSILLRQRARELAGAATESMPLEDIARVLGEIHDLQYQLRELDEFVMLLDSGAVSGTAVRVGQVN